MDYPELEHFAADAGNTADGAFEDERSVFSVSDLTRMVKHILEDSFPAVWVEGEISNFKAHTSGHLYFSIKDENSQMSVVMFRHCANRLRFKPADGLKVMLQGKVTIFERRGSYQLNATAMEPMGFGALQMAFEQLKKKLAAEGLFNSEHKKPIPEFPQTVGVVTSPTGAAIRDILNVMSRRFSGVRVIVNPVRVQGEQAAGEIAAAIDEFNSLPDICPDVLIVGRGGGSIEDLWAFNEEAVARSIFASRIPVVSAVGHEVDWTIADFVSDLRSPTPSAAAELVVPSKEDICHRVESLEFKLSAYVEGMIDNLRLRTDRCVNHYVFREPLNMIRQFQQQVDDLSDKLGIHFNAAFENRRAALDLLNQKLCVLNPLAVLCRGFSVSRKKNTGQVLLNSADIAVGDEVETVLHQGRLISKVEKIISPSAKKTS